MEKDGFTLLENTQGIDKITMRPVVHNKCVIGGDWYTNQLTIVFCPRRYYPDYMQVQEWLMKEVDGKDYNIEDVVSKVYHFLDRIYEPSSLEVTTEVVGCKTHFDVKVEKYYPEY